MWKEVDEWVGSSFLHIAVLGVACIGVLLVAIRRHRSQNVPALEVLKARHEAGELTDEQFARMKDELIDPRRHQAGDARHS